MASKIQKYSIPISNDFLKHKNTQFQFKQNSVLPTNDFYEPSHIRARIFKASNHQRYEDEAAKIRL